VGDKRNGEQMGSKTKLGVAVVAVVLMLGLAAGCSSDSTTTSTNTSGASSQVSGTPNPQYETWCTSVQNLIDQSSPKDLSDIGDLAAFTQAIQSLASTAPEPIQSQMQTLATASQTKLEAVQQDPTATLPQALSDQATSANQDVTTFVSQNCGLQFPTIDL
jgi:maltose-binding protein MalE